MNVKNAAINVPASTDKDKPRNLKQYCEFGKNEGDRFLYCTNPAIWTITIENLKPFHVCGMHIRNVTKKLRNMKYIQTSIKKEQGK